MTTPSTRAQEPRAMDNRARILIVDDEPNVRLVFRTALEAAGYAVSEAADGAAALDSVHRDRADLVLLDLRMPGLGGMEVLRRLRDAGNDVPVVIVTAHGSIPDVVAAMRLGAVDFLPKPVTPAGIREVVDRLARRDDGRPGTVGRESRVSLETGLFDEDLARARRCWTGASSRRPISSCGSPTLSPPAPPRSNASGTAFMRDEPLASRSPIVPCVNSLPRCGDSIRRSGAEMKNPILIVDDEPHVRLELPHGPGDGRLCGGGGQGRRGGPRPIWNDPPPSSCSWTS